MLVQTCRLHASEFKHSLISAWGQAAAILRCVHGRFIRSMISLLTVLFFHSPSTEIAHKILIHSKYDHFKPIVQNRCREFFVNKALFALSILVVILCSCNHNLLLFISTIWLLNGNYSALFTNYTIIIALFDINISKVNIIMLTIGANQTGIGLNHNSLMQHSLLKLELVVLK